MEKDLTQLEILHLPETFNLTDGHAHRSFNKNEQKIVADLSTMFVEVEREQQQELERSYTSAFYQLTGQTVDPAITRCLLLPSASISLEIIANYLRMKKLDLALIEPCFDSLASMFKRHDIQLEPIPEDYLEKEPAELAEFLKNLRSNALCIVSPNNPTGVSYSPAVFRQLIASCKEQQKLLILDTSFRAYKEQQDVFDEYQALQQSGIDFIVVEDTGKTWPTKELKVSILACSASIYKAIYDIYTDFIYHHSPFTIRLLTALVKNSISDNLAGVTGVVEANRRELYASIDGTKLVPREKLFSSVAWIEIMDETLTALQVADTLARHGVFVLPGNQFYWNNPDRGAQFIRIGLARDPHLFKRAMIKFRQGVPPAM